MTVEQTDVIDSVGINTKTDEAMIIITDHLKWGSDEHLMMLQEKVNTALAFVETGQLLEDYPDAKQREVCIRIVFKYDPDESGKRFLKRIEEIIDEGGFRLDYYTFEENDDTSVSKKDLDNL